MKTTTVRFTGQTANNKDVTTKINYANAAATNGVLYQFCVKMNALTKNTFVGAQRIDTEDLEDE